MSDSIHPIEEDELQAYVDGRLSPERRAAVENHLARHPEVAARIESYVTHRQQLREVLRFKAEEPIPPRLRIAALARRRRVDARRWLMYAASVAVAVIVGGAAGWAGRGAFDGGERHWADLAAYALGAHRVFVADARRPVEVRADAEDQLVRWLSSRIGRPIAVPDLRSASLRFMGGRLLATPDGPAAQLMYDDAAGTRVTVFLQADPRPNPIGAGGIRQVSIDGIGSLNWSDERFTYIVSAALDPGRLDAVGRLVRSQVTTDGGRP